MVSAKKTMHLIKHRINLAQDLAQLNSGLGAEIDLRSEQKQIILHHDPFVGGYAFTDFLSLWKTKERGTLILNTKEDGLEEKVLSLLSQHQIEDFFFLDLPIPTMVRLAKSNESRQAMRVSKWESIETAMLWKTKVDWIWLDCFDLDPLDIKIVEQLSSHFKLCLVSPELQKGQENDIEKFQHFIPFLDAVCTKFPQKWGES